MDLGGTPVCLAEAKLLSAAAKEIGVIGWATLAWDETLPKTAGEAVEFFAKFSCACMSKIQPRPGIGAMGRVYSDQVSWAIKRLRWSMFVKESSFFPVGV